mmetsp:Transcript_28411/g.31021  ORF Transcript_28411/g.31021 Transcript_28411/m.31021 type:complete len:426 (-) Transcript_28411:856-2133(-)
MDCLSDEIVVYLLTYFRAIDLATLSGVNKQLFSKSRVRLAVQRTILDSPISQVQTGSKKSNSANSAVLEQLTPSALYVFEVTSFLYVLAYPQPIDNKGYWLSAGWASNAKKYFEACILPDLNTPTRKTSTPKRQSKIRQRRGSDALPPWPDINADLVCAHGGLAVAKTSKSKRRAIDSRCWKMLRKYYPCGPEYRCTTSSECCICLENSFEAKAAANEKKANELLTRRNDLVTPALENIFQRKTGVPNQYLLNKSISVEDYVDDSIHPELIAEMMKFSNHQPLISGMYNIVTREWLREWRRYVKDSKQTTLLPLDCGILFCNTHGHLVIPPHLEEYLLGMRKSLLTGLGLYNGIEVEIITPDEWDEFQKVLHNSYSDLCVRFLLDGDNVVWNCPTCSICDPFKYTPLRSKETKKMKSIEDLVAMK